MLLIIGIVFILFLIFNFLYFILPSLSPIPFFPSNKKDLPLICTTLLAINKKSTIIDLGAGTGTVLFPTAQEAHKNNLNTQFIAVEIHPLLILIMYMRRLLHPNRKNIRIIRANMLTVDYNILLQNINTQSSIVFYLYIGQGVIEQLKKRLVLIKRNIAIVSYMYDIPGWDTYSTNRQKGQHTLTTYQYHSM